MKKLLSVLLAIIIFVSLAAGCETGERETESDASATVSEAEKQLVPHLGDRDLEDFTLTFFTYGVEGDTDPYEVEQFNTDEQDSEPVNEAFYNRNRKIEEKYNCNIEVMLGGAWLEFPGVVRQLINSGDTSFNMLSETLINTALYSQEKLLTNFIGMPNSNLSLESEWWDGGLIEQCSINNRLDFITGDITVTDNEATNVILFNKDMVNKNNIEDLYTLVEDKKWTIDKMYELAKSVVEDDGDSLMTVTGNDIWGNIGTAQTVMSFVNGFGITTATKDTEDIPQIIVKGQEYITAYQKAYSYLCDQSVTAMDRYFYEWNDTNIQLVSKMFPEGKSLFTSNYTVGGVNGEDLRNSEVNYGILPYPMLNAEQADYYSPVWVYSNGFISMPNTVSPDDYDEITFILEAMSYLGKEMVLDEYYTRTLKRKRLNDEESRAMLDIVFKNRTYDLSVIYSWGDIYYENTYNVLAKVDTIVSRLDAIFDKMETARQSTIENFS